MTKIRVFLLFGVVCLFSSNAWALTGGEIYKGCYAAAQDNFNYDSLPLGEEVYVGHCLGLITGFAEMIRLYEGTKAPPVACIPKDVTISMLLDDVVNFLDQNRAHWDMKATVLILIALKNNYLCRS
ncbi:Rap1a/Tai family immunity protein [Marinobacter maritimus]|uniref:Rap1a/Tai family immunity protein n=1 Tax=Marinobacter maritimus TaxID=277961 RepID=UPI00119CCE7C|nr:Rap1a/Tai family immunity protein [Marinobacter maritimus]